MKKLFIAFSVLLMITSCKQDNATGYVINGSAEGVHNGIRVRLAKIDSLGKQVIKDSAIVMDGKFTIKGSVEEPSIYFLSADGTPGNLIFMLENGDITLNFNKDVPMESVIDGSESQKGYDVFKNEMLKFKDEGTAIMEKFKALGPNPTPEGRDAVAAEMESLRQRQGAYPLQYVKENNDEYFSLNLIHLEAGRPNFDIKGYKDAYDNFTSELKDSKKGQIVKRKLDELYKDYQKIAHLEVGKVAPNFEAPDPDGKMISLNDIKGKATIIDFWAAWCGPCRRENPNVVKVYEKYHPKGLEIIGVSLDGQGRQADPKNAWIQAIEKDGLEWHHVSNLKYFNDPVARQYNIQSIPATYILDADGKIVAKNLRGKALENKIAELLK